MLTSKLSEMIKRMSDSTVPPWLRLMIHEKREQIIEVLKSKGEIDLIGPAGEKLTIRVFKPKKRNERGRQVKGKQ